MKTRALIQWLAVLLLLLACIACNKGAGGKTAQNGVGAGSQSPPRQSAPVDAGRAVYVASNCATCHGAELAGSGKLGPPLHGLSADWTLDNLARYLENPQAYKETDPRLSSKQNEYSMLMPAIPMTPENRKALAEWLLTQ